MPSLTRLRIVMHHLILINLVDSEYAVPPSTATLTSCTNHVAVSDLSEAVS